VDALGWRRVLAGESNQPPEAPLSRGLEVHPDGGGRDLDEERDTLRRGSG
jgi:menaquinone-9 beta-reductase